MSEVFSTMPDFSGFLPTILLFCSVIVSIILALVHEFWVMPPISRALRSAKWSKGVTAFIQDLSGNVLLVTSQKELPEGVIKTKRGYFLLPIPGSKLDQLPNSNMLRVKRGPGRPPREQAENDAVPPFPTTKEAQAEYAELYGQMIHIPVLRGLGKQVFFGCIESPMLSNLWTLAHANLLKAKDLIPMNMQKTQLDALATGSRLEGMKMMGGDVMKWIVYVIIACIPIAIIGLVFWFLTQGNGTAA